jgi:hypothetical protein
MDDANHAPLSRGLGSSGKVDAKRMYRQQSGVLGVVPRISGDPPILITTGARGGSVLYTPRRTTHSSV